VNFLKQAVFESETLAGCHLVLDCANGATYEVAPSTFSELGATVQTLFADPDGRNINLNCGSEHPQALAQAVVQAKAGAGFAFDGDGDRVVAVDEGGHVLTGDQMLMICAKALKEEDRLSNNLVVSTVMSNMGLGLALRASSIEHVMAQVGDRFVVREMVARGASLGGEDSGHMIFLEHHTTGDGILTALWLLRAMKKAGKPLSELRRLMDVYPQRLINIEVKSKPPLDSMPEITTAIRRVEEELGDQGRIFVRYSGTQPMCRVMVEAPTQAACEKYCLEVAGVVEAQLG
jgi:phosphoglucosamine mutase